MHECWALRHHLIIHPQEIPIPYNESHCLNSMRRYWNDLKPSDLYSSISQNLRRRHLNNFITFYGRHFSELSKIEWNWIIQVGILKRYSSIGPLIIAYVKIRYYEGFNPMNSRLLQLYFSQLYKPQLFIWRWTHSGSIRKAKGVLDNNFIIFIQIII